MFAGAWGGTLLHELARVDIQSRLPLALFAAELEWVCGDLDAVWHAAGFLTSPEFHSLPGYELPLIAAAARILAARGNAGLGLDSACEAQLRSQLSRDGFWPTHPAWPALFEAELGGDGAPAMIRPRGTAPQNCARRCLPT